MNEKLKELLNRVPLEARELCASVVARALELLRAAETEPSREPLGPYWMVAIDKPNGERLYLATADPRDALTFPSQCEARVWAAGRLTDGTYEVERLSDG